MKKLLAIILAALMLLSMAACAPTQQDGDETGGGQTGDAQTKDKFVVGVCQLMPHDALDAATKALWRP